MKKRVFLPLIAILLTGLLSAACTAQATPVYAEGAEQDQAVAAVDPFAQDILDGIAKNDFALFGKDFDATMAKAMTQSQFDKIVKMFAPYGAFKNRDLTNVEIVDQYYRVNYKVTYENKIVLVSIVISKTGTAAVAGLWFK